MSADEWDFERFTLEAIKVQTTWATLDSETKTFARLITLVNHFPPLQRASALAFMQSGYDAQTIELNRQRLEYAEKFETMKTQAIDKERAWKREGRAFWVGLGLLLVALALSVTLPSDRIATASLFLRISVALGGGMMIGYLPGLFSLDSTINTPKGKVALKATGGLAFIVLVYLFDPGWISSVLSWHK